MTAVRNNAIRPVNDIVITRPGPRLVDGLRDLALAIHPDIVLAAASPSPSAGEGSPAPSATSSAYP